MSTGEWISVAINLAVGLYFIHYFPVSLRRKLPENIRPPFFSLLLKVIPPLGYVLIIATVLYLMIALTAPVE